MKTKFYIFLTMAFLAFQLNAFGQITGYVVFISSADRDSGFIQVLEENQYPVKLYRNYFNGVPESTASIDSLEGAALIIYSRNNPSGNFAGSEELNDFWNGISTPLLSLSPWPLRSTDRWSWTPATGGGCEMQGAMAVLDAEHDFFEGVNITDDSVYIFNDEQIAGDIIPVGDAGNGTLLGTNSEGNVIALAVWEASIPFFDDGPIPAGDRIYLSAGESDCGPSGNMGTMSTYNLNAEGERIFLNIVKKYAGEYVTSIPRAEIALTSNLVLYPNPVEEQLHVSFVTDYSGVVSLSITDIAGKNIYSSVYNTSAGKNNLAIDVSELTQGVYILTLKADNMIQTTRKFTIK